MTNDESPKTKARPSLSKTIVKVGQVAGGLSAVGGFCGDFLKPLASINLIVFALASALTVALLVLCVKKVTVFGYGLGLACGSCLVVAVGFGSWWGLAEFEGGKDRGFLAGKFSLVGRIQDAVLDERKVAGDPIVVEAVKDRGEEERGAQRLQAALKDYPLHALDVKTVGDPRRIDVSGNDVTVAYDLAIGVKPAAYDPFARTLAAALDAEPGRKGEFFTVNTPINLEDKNNVHVRSNFATTVLGSVFSSSRSTDMDFERHIKFRNPVEIGNGMGSAINRLISTDPANRPAALVVLNVSHNELGDRTNWRWFELKAPPELPAGLRINVTFLDKKGQEITRDLVEMKANLPGLSAPPHTPPIVTISPFVVVQGRSFGVMTVTRSLRMTLAELKALSIIRCTAEALRGPDN